MLRFYPAAASGPMARLVGEIGLDAARELEQVLRLRTGTPRRGSRPRPTPCRTPADPGPRRSAAARGARTAACPRSRTPSPPGPPPAWPGATSAAPASVASFSVSTRCAPDVSASTGRSPATNTSDFTIWATSQPIARAASSRRLRALGEPAHVRPQAQRRRRGGEAIRAGAHRPSSSRQLLRRPAPPTARRPASHASGRRAPRANARRLPRAGCRRGRTRSPPGCAPPPPPPARPTGPCRGATPRRAFPRR